MQSGRTMRSAVRSIGFDPAYLEAFDDKLFISGPKTVRRLVNFFVLLLLATVIATYGVLSASTATVIGAMIVAPLMGPIMATAAAVVMGSGKRALRALALVLVGVVCVIALSFVLALGIPNTLISFTNNPEITSRIEPGLVALITALASGAAGAYITMRAEIADSMGGVAIAISLVPPLCVVGIALQAQQWGAAGGALMLFLTNFLAILLAGGLIFLLSGLGRLANASKHQQLRRNAFVVIVVATCVVAIPLALTSYDALLHVKETQAVTNDVRSWLAGTQQELISVNVNGSQVYVIVEGSGALHPLRELANHVSKTLNRPIMVDLRMVPAETQPSDNWVASG